MKVLWVIFVSVLALWSLVACVWSFLPQRKKEG